MNDLIFVVDPDNQYHAFLIDGTPALPEPLDEVEASMLIAELAKEALENLKTKASTDKE